ncbi:acyltransferase family protein [Sphingomonas sp. PL20]|uniref:acyltransferase family protein n=1 Tax=Sphingomonas sp. PL20 TaxID=2760712 RepID=UPI001AE46157
MDRSRYHTLDAMRGLAAIWVLLLHTGWIVGLPLAGEGYLAVDFFFALSGFVLAGAYGGKLRSQMRVSQFVELRYIRLYPLFIVGLALGAVKGLGQIIKRDDLALTPLHYIGNIAANLIILPAPFDDRFLFPLNAPAWSLFLELIINIFFATFLFRARASLLLFICMISAPCILIGAFRFGSAIPGGEWSWIGLGVARVSFSFCAGMLLHRLRTGRDKQSTWLTLAPLAALLLVLTPQIPDGFRIVYDLIMIVAILPLIIYFGAAWEMPLSIQRSGAFLGDISYPLYIVHFPILTIGWFVARRFMSPLAFTITLTLMLIALAWILAVADAKVRAQLSQWLRLRRSAKLQTIST